MKTFPSQGRQHVAALDPSFDYNSFPSTSGPHYPLPAAWNPYTREIPQAVLVHNLEHGGVVVQFGAAVPRTTVRKIFAWYLADPDGIVLAPLPQLGQRIALTAWRHLATCTRFDATAFGAFRDRYRFKGPERLPRSAMKPGQ